MTITISILAGLATMSLALLLRPRTASAHCDTMEGPTVKDGELALRTGNLNHALKWVSDEDADELGRVFTQAQAVRTQGEDVRFVADAWFLENLVRIHRAGEGAPYTGIKPAGAPVDPRVRAADAAIDAGSVAPLVGVVPDDVLPELEQRLAAALEHKDFDVDDVEAGRAYLEAYVRFFKLAEGHAHEHHRHVHHDAHTPA